MKLLRTTICLVSSLVCTALAAQTAAVDYAPETGVISFETMPEGVSAARSSVSISDAHYKLGAHSLQWKIRKSGASLEMDVPVKFLPVNPNPDDTSVSSFVFWIYSAEPVDGSLHFSFRKEGRECCSFDYLLGFTGWRGAWVSFDRDMNGHPEENMDAFSVSYNGSSRNASLWFDGIIPASFQDVRYHTADFQAPFVNPHTTSFWLTLNQFWNNRLDIEPAAQVTAGEQEAFSTIEERYKQLVTSGVKVWSIKQIRNYYRSWGIGINPDGSIKGKPVWFVRYSETYLDLGLDAKRDFTANGQLLKDLNDSMMSIALSWDRETDPDLKAEIGAIYLYLTRHLLDQGFQAGSGQGTLHHLGYSMRNFYNAPVVAKSLLRSAGLLSQVQQAMEWFSGYGEVKTAPREDGMDVDAFNTLLMGRLASVLLMEDSPLKAASLKALSRWVDNGYKYTEGLRPCFKRDGTVVHHRKCYPAYATGGFKGSVNAIWMLAGTEFAVSPESHENQKRALLEMRFWCNQKSFPIAMSGRHPDGKGALIPSQYALLADAGSPDGTRAIDPELAAAYLRFNIPGEWTEKFTAAGLTAEKSPVGGRFYPYDCSLSYRQDNWLVTFAGHSRYIWAAEHYKGENMYGRYLAHGSMQILGSPEAAPDSFGSGFRQEGWDWTHIPGTTAAAVPMDRMKADILNVDEFSGFEEMLLSDEYFAGGVAKDSDAAAYSFILHEHDKYNPSLRARKSWFAFGNRIICLGTGICNSEAEAHTTLFQNSVDETFADEVRIWESGCSITDRLGNYYLVPDARVQLTTGLQHSFHEESCKPTEGRFQTAWINHGQNCRDASYLYAVIPGPSAQAEKAALEGSFQVLRRDNSAHIVKDNVSGLVAASVFEETSIDGTIAQSSPCVMIYSGSEDSLDLSIASADLALYEGPSDELFDAEGKRIERSIYGRKWVDNPAAETQIRLCLRGEWKLLSHECAPCYEKLAPVLSYENGNTVLTIRTRECRTEKLKLAKNE